LGALSLVLGLGVGGLAAAAGREWWSGADASQATALFGTMSAWWLSLGILHLRQLPARALAVPAIAAGVGGLGWGASLFGVTGSSAESIAIVLAATAPFLVASARHGLQARGGDPWWLSILGVASVPVAIYALFALLVGLGMPHDG
jgi:hypothetical protein